MSTPQDIEDIDFRSMLRTLRRAAVPILLTGLAAAMLSMVLFAPKETFVSSATLELLPEVPAPGQPAGNRSPVTSEELTLLKSRTFQSLVARKLGVPESGAQYGVRSPEGTALLVFAVVSESPKTALTTLKAVLEICTDLRLADFRAKLEEVRKPLAAAVAEDLDRLAAVNKRIESLDSERSAASDALISTAALLETRIAEGTAGLRNYDVSLQRGLYRVVLAPSTNSIAGQGRLSKAVTGLFIGLIAAVAVALLRERLRDLVRNRRDVLRAAPDTDVFGEIRERPSSGAGGDSFGEDVDRLYSSLELALQGLAARRIVLAPVSLGDVVSLANELSSRCVRAGIDASTSTSDVATTSDDTAKRLAERNRSAAFVVCRSVERHADALRAAGNADAVVLVAQAGRTTRRELAVALDDARRATTARTFVVLQDVARADYRLAPPTRSS